ncbi:MAG: SH3 domain-containing protein [Clostridia bacterium]|nr:SH3 domain-containing protein [Clostridia bacterium]
MKIVVRILIVLIIAVPIYMCWKTLQTVWDEPENSNNVVSTNTGNSATSGDLKNVEELINNEEKKVTASNLGDGISYDVTGINIISKVYENAQVAISIANIYEEHDETSKVVGKLEKGSQITVQNYDNGWSTVTNYTYSGWMKTENIKLPSEDTNMVITQTSEEGSKLGTVKVQDGLNVRASASTTADIIASLNNGTVVSILDDSTKGWYKIKVNNTVGWVSSDYVTVK